MKVITVKCYHCLYSGSCFEIDVGGEWDWFWLLIIVHVVLDLDGVIGIGCFGKLFVGGHSENIAGVSGGNFAGVNTGNAAACNGGNAVTCCSYWDWLWEVICWFVLSFFWVKIYQCWNALNLVLKKRSSLKWNVIIVYIVGALFKLMLVGNGIGVCAW